jgi:hypothetical protein
MPNWIKIGVLLAVDNERYALEPTNRRIGEEKAS